ncbi:PIR protein [Plasmodium vivax]|nr:PIR protein [Plasmodium vivax]
MSSFCPDLDKNNSKQNQFFVNCSSKYLIPWRKNWDVFDENYIKHINNIKDPILRHISVYFVQYYIDGYYYFKDSERHFRNTACLHLKHWLQGKKDLFTYGEKCHKKVKIWEKEIEPLWDIFKKGYTIQNAEVVNPWCDKTSLSLKTEYPQFLTSVNCEEGISQEPSSAYPCPQPVIKECDCSKYEVSVSPSLPVQTLETHQTTETDQPPQTDRTKNLAVTSGFTAVGTLGTLFFLYRFTPMASWFRRPGMNHVGTDLYMGPGAPDAFLSMPHENGGNNLFYQP